MYMDLLRRSDHGNTSVKADDGDIRYGAFPRIAFFYVLPFVNRACITDDFDTRAPGKDTLFYEKNAFRNRNGGKIRAACKGVFVYSYDRLGDADLL